MSLYPFRAHNHSEPIITRALQANFSLGKDTFKEQLQWSQHNKATLTPRALLNSKYVIGQKSIEQSFLHLKEIFVPFEGGKWEKFSAEKIFRHQSKKFCPTLFCPIRYKSIAFWKSLIINFAHLSEGHIVLRVLLSWYWIEPDEISVRQEVPSKARLWWIFHAILKSWGLSKFGRT